MQRILAIAWLTWKAALRFRLFVVITALLLASVAGLPLLIQDDGTARGFTQIIITYTLTVITTLLGFSTLWLSCGTLARDIEECQMQVVATKPIARWQIWLGKWAGIMSLNAVLLAISGACVYGVLQWRATRLPAEVQKTLRSEVMVARGTAREADMTAEIDAAARQILQERLKSSPVTTADLPEVQRQIREQVKAAYQVVPPASYRTWEIDLSALKDELRDKPLQLRIKFNTASASSTPVLALWQAGDPQKQHIWQSEPMSLAPNTFHEFQIPPNLLDDKGVLTVVFANPNPTALLFSLDDGLEVLYPAGGFGMNFIRGLAIIFCWMALLAALGLAAASFLSFPVATFFSLAMLLVMLSSDTLADAVDNGTIGVGNEETGQAGHSEADVVLIPFFKGVLALVKLVKNFSPIDALSTGHVITWAEVGVAFGQIVLLIGGIIGIIGIALFYRRELAAAQGTQ